MFGAFGEDKMALVTSCRQRDFLFTNTHLFYVIDDWLVLEIITQWTGKTIL